MKKQDIEKLKAFCEKEGFEIKESHEGQTFFIKKKVEDAIRVKVRDIIMYQSTKMQLTIYSENHMPFSLESNEEFMNHIEESIESYLNAKSPSKNN